MAEAVTGETMAAKKAKAPRQTPGAGAAAFEAWIDDEDAKAPGFKAELNANAAQLALAGELRRLREAAGLTQAELAEKVGTQAPGIARMESGRFAPRLEVLHRVAAALGMRVRITFEPAGPLKPNTRATRAREG